MADRILGATRCAHCRAAAAERTCPSCAASVCATCSVDWTTCSEPVGRELRLGVGRRLRRVTSDGHFGVAGGPLRVERWIDLRRIAWASFDAPAPSLPAQRRVTDPEPLPDGTWLMRREKLVQTGEGAVWSHCGYDLVGAGGELVAAWAGVPQLGPITVSPGGRAAWGVARGEAVWTFALAAPLRAAGSPVLLPGEVMQAVAVDLDRRRAVAGTWGALTTFRVDGAAWEPVGRISFGDGDATWVGIGGGRVAAGVDRKRIDTVSVWEIDEQAASTGQRASIDYPDGLRKVGALSPDGRYVAVATLDHRVLLMDVDARTTTELEGHTDDVCFIGFVDGGRQLVTADCDNRVIIRPRTSSGYATLVRPATVG